MQSKQHQKSNCKGHVKFMQVCDHLSTISKTKGGGKNKKKQQGRPSKENIYDVTRHIHTITPPAITSPITTSSELATTLQCPICADILCQPIELSCGSLVCSQCCCKWLQFSQKLDCPCCYSHQLSTETIKTPNSVILGLFEKRQVPQQSQITVQAILDTPRTTPTNHVEKQVATSLVKRLLSESEGGVISIPTKGKVTYTVK